MRSVWLLMLFGLFLAPVRAGRAEDWPVVRDFEMSVGLRMNGPRLDLDVPFYGMDGKILYRFICRGGDDARRAQLGELGADYLWPMTCILNLGNHETGLSLLSEDEAAAYFSRGAVYAQDLMICGDYPEFGRLRHFRLRGFELTFQFSDLVIDKSKVDKTGDFVSPLDYAVLKVTLRHDATITSAKTEQPGYLRPELDTGKCSPVKRGNPRRMCRNPKTFSWEECPIGYENKRFSYEHDLAKED